MQRSFHILFMALLLLLSYPILIYGEKYQVAVVVTSIPNHAVKGWVSDIEIDWPTSFTIVVNDDRFWREFASSGESKIYNLKACSESGVYMLTDDFVDTENSEAMLDWKGIRLEVEVHGEYDGQVKTSISYRERWLPEQCPPSGQKHTRSPSFSVANRNILLDNPINIPLGRWLVIVFPDDGEGTFCFAIKIKSVSGDNTAARGDSGGDSGGHISIFYNMIDVLLLL